MSSLYAMLRANGDWFALEHQGRLRIPIYRTRQMAWDAHARISEMLLFRPFMLNESMLTGLAATDRQGDVCFWLVESSSHNPLQGKMLEFAEIASLVREQPKHQKKL